MNKKLRGILASGLLAAAMLTGAAAENVTVTPVGNVTLSAYDAAGNQITTPGGTQYEDPAYFNVTYKNDGIKQGSQYILLMVSGDGKQITQSTIRYINQMASENGTITFDQVYPDLIENSVIFLSGDNIGATLPLTLANITTGRIRGDVDNNGKIDINDVTLILSHIAELSELTGDDLICAEVTDNGKVDIDDITRIPQHITEIEPLPWL